MNLSICVPDCFPITITTVELPLLAGTEASTVLDTATTAAWSVAVALVLATNIPLILILMKTTNTFLDKTAAGDIIE